MERVRIRELVQVRNLDVSVVPIWCLEDFWRALVFSACWDTEGAGFSWQQQ